MVQVGSDKLPPAPRATPMAAAVCRTPAATDDRCPSQLLHRAWTARARLLAMTAAAVTSPETHSRLERGRAWLEARPSAEEVLILAANSEAASHLVREMAKAKGAAFGWHRLSLAQLAATIALPALTERGLVSIS